MSYALFRLLAALFAWAAATHLVINGGLRLLPAGRAWLAAERARGRLLAVAGPGAGAAVLAVFWGGQALGLLAALAVFARLGGFR